MDPDKRIYFDPPATEAKTFSATRGAQAKDLLAKIARLIPGEILGAYGFGVTTLPTFDASVREWVGIGWFIAGILGTAWYVGWRIGKHFRKQNHMLVYMWAFAVWAYALTGASVMPHFYLPGLAMLLVAATSVGLAKVKLPAREVR